MFENIVENNNCKIEWKQASIRNRLLNSLRVLSRKDAALRDRARAFFEIGSLLGLSLLSAAARERARDSGKP